MGHRDDDQPVGLVGGSLICLCINQWTPQGPDLVYGHPGVVDIVDVVRTNKAKPKETFESFERAEGKPLTLELVVKGGTVYRMRTGPDGKGLTFSPAPATYRRLLYIPDFEIEQIRIDGLKAGSRSYVRGTEDDVIGCIVHVHRKYFFKFAFWGR